MPHKGMGAHQSAAMISDTWLTPPHVLAALGPFDLDPCAAPTPRPWSTAATHWTKEDDGLSRVWFGRVWLNPPYGGAHLIGPWIRKMVQHGVGTALIFARTETELFHESVWNSADAILFLRGRLFFCRSNGFPAKHNAGAPSCLVAYGETDAFMLRYCGLPGAFVELRRSGK